MDLIQLDYFVTACEKGSLSRVAACRYTSQPNVSKKIRELEKELGHSLLQRNRKGVLPTEYGKSVLDYARMILKTADAISALEVPEQDHSLRISTYPSNMISQVLLDYYETCREKCAISHRVGTAEEIAGDVGRGISEIGIVYMAKQQVMTYCRAMKTAGLVFTPLKNTSICIYTGPQSPLQEKQSVSFEELKTLRLVGNGQDFYSVENDLEQLSGGAVTRRDLHYSVISDSEHMMDNALQQTDLCCISLDAVAGHRAKFRPIPIEGCESVLTIGCIYRDQTELSDSAKWILRRLESVL